MTLYSDKFTNLYSLSKTLRFELKPLPETVELLKKKNLLGKTPVEIDQEKDELYHKELKPMFDQLHEMFITESLKIIQFDRAQLEQLEQQYQTLKALNKDKNTNSVAIDQLVNPKTGLIAHLETKLREV
ncbi:hypothetical protein HGB07_09840, partial [Candidatus Roizmanbacteria bacterium]|nr:hypothetical protein [Candidatus Roizmanbacteria bacterium]